MKKTEIKKERQFVRRQIDAEYCSIRNLLDQCGNNYDATIEIEPHYDGCDQSVYLTWLELETEQEFEKRTTTDELARIRILEAQKKDKERTKKAELKEYERLHKKYGLKNGSTPKK